MLLKRNFLETLSIGCCCGTVFLIFIHSITSISPITGVWFPIYLVVLFSVSIVFSFRFLKWLISLNRPVKYDLEGLVAQYPILKYFMGSMLEVYQAGRRKSTQMPYKEYDTNELSVISSVLERKLVSSWYVQYISQEIGFPFACKQLLDQMIGKAFQISHKIETKDVYIGVCLVLATHLREYRRALQRHEKSPSSPVELYYKKSHYMFRDDHKPLPSGDHCIKILRLICKDLVPWELWDTPHSELIIRILSKRLDDFIETTLSNPVWLNDKLVTILLNKNDGNICNSESTKEKPLDNTLNNKDEITKLGETVEPKKIEVLETEISKEKLNTEIRTIPIVNATTIHAVNRLQANGNVNVNGKVVEELTNGVEEAVATSCEPIDIQTSPILRQRRGRQHRNEVKIYDKIIEGSVKTWETDVDLRCCSLGQDLLATLDGEITLSRLWEQDPEMEVSPNPPRRRSPQLWFGEEDQLDLELPESPRSPHKKQHSPKSAELLLKDLASSVSTAKSKLEGFQVDLANGARGTNLSIAGDEAAGMMEGLLDRGLAGLKKGLRLTGLGDDPHHQDKDKSPALHREQHTNNGSPAHAQASSRNGSEGDVVCEDTQSGTDALPEGSMALPILQKQQRVISQDSMGLAVSEAAGVAGAGAGAGGGRSPSPQYEEVTDLSATIAKLRSLLNDRSEEVVLWEGAAETRGHTSRRHHAGVDSATRADEYDMNTERNSPNQVANNMQRLDKLLRGTVSGVFNSIREAVGGEGGEGAEGGEGGAGRTHTWHYVTLRPDTGVCSLVSGAVCGARALAPADAALDSLDALDVRPPPAPPRDHSAHLDYEEWLVQSGWRVCGAAELWTALGAARHTHVALTLLLHDIIDPLIGQFLDEVTSWLRLEIFQQFEAMAQQQEASSSAAEPEPELREMNLQYTCQLIMDKIPGILQLLGEDTLRESVETITSSLSHREVTRDVVYRLLDVFAMHFSHAATVRNPSFDA